MRSERVRLQPYVDAPLAHPLAAYSAATGETTSFVDRLRRTCERHQRDLEIHMKAFAIYVKLWFAHTPQIADKGKDYARRTAESRFAQFTGVRHRPVPGR